MTELTEAEQEALREALSEWHHVGCNADCLVPAVERIIDASLAPVRALANEWEAEDFRLGQYTSWYEQAYTSLRAALSAHESAPQPHDGTGSQPDDERAGDALRDAAAWIAEGTGYPIECRFTHRPMPEPLWEALVDHVHADESGQWHGNTLNRADTASWLAEEAGR